MVESFEQLVGAGFEIMLVIAGLQAKPSLNETNNISWSRPFKRLGN
jgi:hypothetical protein